MKNNRLFWKIVKQIEELIDSGQYQVGMRLPPERVLSQMFSVSRPTVREAIIAIEVRGKVEVKTGSGVYVLPSSQERIEVTTVNTFELTQARAIIEGEVAALAAVSISEDELSALRNSLEKMKDRNSLEKADEEFHNIIVRATHNEAMTYSVNNLWSLRKSKESIVQDYKSVCDKNLKETINEHRDIFNALKKHDPNLARECMHKHFNRMLNSLVDSERSKALAEVQRQSDLKRDQYSINNLYSH